MQVGVSKAWYADVTGKEQSKYQHSAEESGPQTRYLVRVYPPSLSYAILSIITRCCEQMNIQENVYKRE